MRPERQPGGSLGAGGAGGEGRRASGAQGAPASGSAVQRPSSVLFPSPSAHPQAPSSSPHLPGNSSFRRLMAPSRAPWLRRLIGSSQCYRWGNQGTRGQARGRGRSARGRGRPVPASHPAPAACRPPAGAPRLRAPPCASPSRAPSPDRGFAAVSTQKVAERRRGGGAALATTPFPCYRTPPRLARP